MNENCSFIRLRTFLKCLGIGLRETNKVAYLFYKYLLLYLRTMTLTASEHSWCFSSLNVFEIRILNRSTNILLSPFYLLKYTSARDKHPRIKSIPSYASDRHIYVCILGHLMACQCLELASGSNICQHIQNLVRVKSSSIKQTTDLLKNSATHPLTIHKSTKWKGQKCNIVVIATSVLIK